jgi:hypothetical protein
VSWLCSATALAQGTPEEVARQQFAAIQAEGIGAVVDYLHPDALAEFKGIVLPVFELAGSDEIRSYVFGGPTTLQEIRAMDPSEVMRAFLGSFGEQFEDLQVSFDEIEIVGVVPEGERRHVLARMTVSTPDFTIKEYEVLSLKPFEDTWRLELSSEMQSMASAFRMVLNQLERQQ